MYKQTENRYLYHYTSLANLALILSNKTLRLFPLSNMDDLQEAKSRELVNYGRFVYISSWTKEEKESIPMWKMYSAPTVGVRIGLKENPFKVYDFKNGGYREVGEDEVALENGLKAFCNVFSPFQTSTYKIRNPIYETQLVEVQYSDDEKDLFPNILNHTGPIRLNGERMGVFKNTYWEFQQEVRYRVILYVDAIDQRLNGKKLEDVISENIELLPDYVDLHLSDNAIENIVIKVAPDFSMANRILLQALLDKYAPMARIEDSALSNLIR